jgi:hypothetical protein
MIIILFIFKILLYFKLIMPKRSSKKRSPKRSKKRSPKRSKKRSSKKRSSKRSSSKKRSPKRSSSKKRSTKNKIPKLRKGELKQFGYSSANSVASRHRALAKAIREYSDLSVYRKINVLYIFNKNKNPTLAKKFNSDKAWIKKTYMV